MSNGTAAVLQPVGGNLFGDMKYDRHFIDIVAPQRASLPWTKKEKK